MHSVIGGRGRERRKRRGGGRGGKGEEEKEGRRERGEVTYIACGGDMSMSEYICIVYTCNMFIHKDTYILNRW